MMTRRLLVKYSILSLVFLAAGWLGAQPVEGAEAQLKSSVSATKIRLAVPSPSLSYLPIHVALKKGFFTRRGFDIEVIQMAAGLTAPALLNRAIDYTTVPSGEQVVQELPWRWKVQGRIFLIGVGGIAQAEPASLATRSRRLR